MNEQIEVEAVWITQQQLQAHIHVPGGGHDIFTFEAPGLHHPAMRTAIHELNECVKGAIVGRMREALKYAVGESGEGVTIGSCKICKYPVASNDPGIKINGPFMYCPDHADA